MKQLFTSESVTEGHPDKICDQISDAVLDAILAQDPYARVACETCTTTGIVMVMGEVTTTADYRVDDIVREVVCDIGYDRAKYGFDGHTCAVLTAMHGQSPDIAMGVDDALEGRGVGDMDIGAGDQGMMFGFACDETPEMMPMPIALAHRITRRLSQARRSEELPWLRPDGKSQVTIEYDGDKPVRVDTVVVSTQHAPEISHEVLSAAIIDKVICKSIPAELMDENTRFLINPTGRFTIGGPMGDSRLTGREGGKASSTAMPTSSPTADMPATAAARSAARIRQRSIAAPRMPRATSRRTSLRRDWPNAVKSSWLTRSAWPIRFLCWSIRRAPASFPTTRWRKSSESSLIFVRLASSTC